MTAGRVEVLAERTWPEVGGGLLVVPLGACEQHGAHLPIGTDTIVANALALRLAASRPDTSAAPALPYGASGEHAGFAGTLSIGLHVLRLVIIELVRSAGAFQGVVLVSGHGGNAAALADAAAVLRGEGRAVLVWSPSASAASAAAGHPADAHAGYVETSVLLALEPDLVRAERAVAGDTRPLPSILADLRASGVAEVSPNGILGDPAGASAEAGGAILDVWTEELCTATERWCPTGPHVVAQETS